MKLRSPFMHPSVFGGFICRIGRLHAKPETMNHEDLLERMKWLKNWLPADVRESLQRAWDDELPQVTTSDAQINKMQRILGEIELASTAVGGMYHYYRLDRIPDQQLDLIVLRQFARDYRYEQGLDRQPSDNPQVSSMAEGWFSLLNQVAA